MNPPTQSSALPDYVRPPVVETVLGVQFDRLPKFGNGHLGAFWKTLDQAEWVSAADAPTLEPQFERFGESARWAKGYQIQLSQDPASRLQIRNRSGDRMIQVQNGRLHFNWSGMGEKYPRYEAVRAGFQLVFEQFVNFIASENVGEFQPNQWEVTYLNQIPKGTVWDSPIDWGFFKPLAGVPTMAELVTGESFGGEWHFVIPEERGRLHVQWRHGLKVDPVEQEMIVLTLTARGPVTASGTLGSEAMVGLDLGRRTIVKSFASFMSKAANDYWGLKNADD